MKTSHEALLFKYLLVFSASLLLANLSVSFSSAADIHDSNLKQQTDSILIENWSFMILFETNRHRTDTFSEQKVEMLKKKLHQYPAFSVRLEARTDSVGSPQYNIALAERRMSFIRKELIKRGIEKDRFVEFVFGEEKPLAENNSPEGRQANRSVRVVAGLYSPVRVISGRFVSDDDGRGIGGILYTGSRHHRDSFVIDSSGEFSFPVPTVDDKLYMEFYSKVDRIMKKTFFDLDEITTSFNTIPVEILKAGVNISFEDVLFKGANTNLVPGSEQALYRLLNLVRYLEKYRFEIQGHITTVSHSSSTIGTIARGVSGGHKEHWLADARAKKVYNYLIENGIDSNRLEWKGYGNSLMVFPNPKTKSQHRRNRRVSVKVLGRIDD